MKVDILLNKKEGISLDTLFEYLANSLFELNIKYANDNRHYWGKVELIKTYVTKIEDDFYCLDNKLLEIETGNNYNNTQVYINLYYTDDDYVMSVKVIEYRYWENVKEFSDEFYDIVKNSVNYLRRENTINKIIN